MLYKVILIPLDDILNGLDRRTILNPNLSQLQFINKERGQN